MRGLLTIYRRELAGLFFSPLAWILLVVSLFMNGTLFVLFLRDAGGNVSSALTFSLGGGMTFWALLIFLPPLLTMRLISEESRTGTLEFLLTSPVSDASVVVGKFLAATTFLAILWSSGIVYALAIDRLGVEPDWGPVFGSFIGAVLASGLFVAIGLLASSFTNTPLVAAFLAFMAGLGWLILPWIAQLALVELQSYLTPWAGNVAAAQQWVATVLEQMDVLGHFRTSFSIGVLDTAEVVFFLAWTSFFLLLTVRSLEARRWRG